jgi:hypothetical protein
VEKTALAASARLARFVDHGTGVRVCQHVRREFGHTRFAADTDRAMLGPDVPPNMTKT